VCVVVVYLSEFSSDCTIIIRNTIYQDHNDCRSSKVPYIERFNSLLLKFQLLKASFGAFGHLDHLLDHLLDLGGLQDQLVGKDLLGYHRRLLVGPPASSGFLLRVLTLRPARSPFTPPTPAPLSAF